MSFAPSTGELMDRVYRHQRYFYDATRKYFLLGRDHLIACLGPPTGGSVLEIGCGTGRNLILAKRAHPDAHAYGIDISSEMLSTAHANLARAGLADAVVLARGDAAFFDPEALFGRPCFDRVFFSYSLSMIPRWREALELAVRCLAPGGRLHVVDFGQQEHLPAWFRRLLFAWLGRFHVSPRAELEEIASALADKHGASCRLSRLYRGYAWYVELER
jgi:S-adenosylmethionine-diacylgycerolhomoserine-N-methlytransferase